MFSPDVPDHVSSVYRPHLPLGKWLSQTLGGVCLLDLWPCAVFTVSSKAIALDHV